jgi:hypothetical protein
VSPPLPPQTLEELTSERTRQLRNLRWGAAALAAAGTLVCLGGAAAVALGHTPALLAAGIVAIVVAGLTAARARLRAQAPLPDAPRFADLPEDDPRKAVPLATRRRTWVLAAAAWLLALLLAGGAVWAMGPSSPALVKLALFLGVPAGTLLAGARLVRRRNGTTRWPT